MGKEAVVGPEGNVAVVAEDTEVGCTDSFLSGEVELTSGKNVFEWVTPSVTTDFRSHLSGLTCFKFDVPISCDQCWYHLLGQICTPS